MEYDIYGDIAKRTDGDIYIGVVGPVRTGKSTFITKFMETMVLPQITGSKKQIAVDEMPQSAAGKTVMTTEPKFVPSEAVSVNIGNKNAKVRLIDCVGFLTNGALGVQEDGKERLVKTPWSAKPLPFKEAAKEGTLKVILDHSTIGVVITSDGSFTDIKREDYIMPEEEVIATLKSTNKPFIVVFNTKNPDDEKVKAEAMELENRYGVGVVAADVLNMDKSTIEYILGKVLEEFPVRIVDISLPDWICSLNEDGNILSYTINALKNSAEDLLKMRDCHKMERVFDDSDCYEPISDMAMDMASGRVNFSLSPKSGLFYRALSEAVGREINKESELMDFVQDLTRAKANYDRIKEAYETALNSGYGVASAEFDDATFAAPEVVKKSGQYCVQMRADFQSLHLIRADLCQEINPVFGSKEQCENFVSLVEEEGYNAKVFGRTLKEVVDEELKKKCSALSDGVKTKLKRVVTKAVNENKNGFYYLLI